MSKRVSYRELAAWDLFLWKNDDNTATTEQLQLAMLCSIRDELKALNRLLSCPNFIEIPSILREIRRNTRKKPKVRAKGKPKLRVVGGSKS